MAVKYGEFTFAKSPPRPTMRSRGGPSTPMAYASGGSVSTPFRYKDGGGITKYPGHTSGRKNVAVQGAGASNVKTKNSKDPGPTRADKGMRSDKVMPPAFAKGGHAAGCSCKMCSGGPAIKKDGGSIKMADGKVKMGAKTSWNQDDAVSPGSPKRTPPGQGVKNKSAASSKFATDGENTEPATKQTGNAERMSGWSDFKKGGKVHKKAAGGKITTPFAYAKGGRIGDRFEMSDGDGATKKVSDGTTSMKGGGRIKNLGHYAHGGKVRPGEKAVNAGKYESAAGTPRTAPGTRDEKPSGVAKKAEGGLSRGSSPKRNAAIHAKSHKPSMGGHKSPGGGALAGLANALSGQSAPSQGGGMSPPGMAPSMGSPPGGNMGSIAPQAPTMGGGPPAMAKGGGMNIKHVIVHHVSHGHR